MTGSSLVVRKATFATTCRCNSCWTHNSILTDSALENRISLVIGHSLIRHLDRAAPLPPTSLVATMPVHESTRGRQSTPRFISRNPGSSQCAARRQGDRPDTPRRRGTRDVLSRMRCRHSSRGHELLLHVLASPGGTSPKHLRHLRFQPQARRSRRRYPRQSGGHPGFGRRPHSDSQRPGSHGSTGRRPRVRTRILRRPSRHHR